MTETMQYSSEDMDVVFEVPEQICVLAGYLCNRNAKVCADGR